MKTRLTTIMMGGILIIGVGYGVFLTKKPITTPVEMEMVKITNSPDILVDKITTKNGSPAVSTPKSEATSLPTTMTTTITLSQVSAHNSKESCWSVINGTVYDLTSWIPNHPGGENKILNICGIDGSNNFNKKHSGSIKVNTILTGFSIGTL